MDYSNEFLLRFWAKVRKGPGCWEWLAAKSHGYGRIKILGRMLSAHRVSWSIANGRQIPDGLEVDHMCFNPACVNPDHLRLLTRAENAAIHPPWKKPNEIVNVCPQGHDKRLHGRTKQGKCAVCQRAHNREYMRRTRASAA